MPAPERDSPLHAGLMGWRDALGTELGYVVLLFALFVVPRGLQRWRIPSPITSVALGALASIGLGLFAADRTVALLSTFGIVALFLFAGLDVDFPELRRGLRIIIQHLAIRAVLLSLVGVAAAQLLDLEPRPAALVSLALLTPSTGFILNSLESFGLTPEERFWVKSKAIATEILALAVLFVVLQSVTVERLTVSALALLGLIAVLPLLFRGFAVWIAPFAPKSEFAFLLMLAVVCAYATRELGVYYLVGAFIVGVAAHRFRERLPAMASEQMLHAVELFASFFIPFYFFHAGLELTGEDFGWPALRTCALLVATGIPLGAAATILHRQTALRESATSARRVAVALTPTLVFTLVLAQILRDRFGVSPALFGGLVGYAVVTTLVPAFLFRTARVEFVGPAPPGPPTTAG